MTIKEKVFEYLAHRCNYTTMAHAAFQLGLNSRTVTKYRNELVEEGALVVDSWKGEEIRYTDGRNISVNFPAYDAKIISVDTQCNGALIDIEIEQVRKDYNRDFPRTMRLCVSSQLLEKIKSIDTELPFYEG